MTGLRETQIFNKHLKASGLKETIQRRHILDTFLATEKHVSVEDLYRLVNRGKRHVGYATVHRTMKLIAESGLASEVIFDDGIVRFEHSWGQEHKHHHHLVCSHCRKIVEFHSSVIDSEEEKILKEHGFKPLSHRYEIFGICAACQEKAVAKRER